MQTQKLEVVRKMMTNSIFGDHLSNSNLAIYKRKRKRLRKRKCRKEERQDNTGYTIYKFLGMESFLILIQSCRNIVHMVIS